MPFYNHRITQNPFSIFLSAPAVASHKQMYSVHILEYVCVLRWPFGLWKWSLFLIDSEDHWRKRCVLGQHLWLCQWTWAQKLVFKTNLNPLGQLTPPPWMYYIYKYIYIYICYIQVLKLCCYRWASVIARAQILLWIAWYFLNQQKSA